MTREPSPPWDKRLAAPIVRLLAPTGVHPNVITTTGLLLGLGAGVMFAIGGPALVNWAAVLFMVAALADHVDGELARATGKTSEFGHYYDRIAMVIANVALFAGIGVGLRHGVLGGWAVIMGVIAGFSVVSIFLIRSKAEKRLGSDIVRHDAFAGFEMEDALYLIGPVTWLGALTPFLVAAAIGAPAFLLLTFWQTRRGKSVTAAWWR
ncbi:MAG: CDP-alcohol phosphatidyltransferase family protein [Sphingomonadales bacterium]